MGRAATLGCRGDGVGTEPLGSGRDLALPARAGWGRRKLGVSLSARWGTWGGGGRAAPRSPWARGGGGSEDPTEVWARGVAPPLPRPRLRGHSPEVTGA